MKSNSRLNLPACPKYQSEDTTKNGTTPSKLGRIQRLRCNNCKHIWTESDLQPLPRRVDRVSNQPTNPSEPSIRSSPATPAICAQTTTTMLEPHSPVTLHYRRLELDIPLDWSSTGLLNFARAAQHDLVQATMSFGHPGLAEFEWNALSQRLKVYVKAKHHLDFALLLQLSAVFGTPDATGSLSSSSASLQVPNDSLQSSPQMLEPQISTASYSTRQPKQRATKTTKHASSRVKQKQSQKRSQQSNLVTPTRTQTKTTLETSSASTSAVKPADDPDRVHWLETLITFQEERQQWSQEREVLQKSLRELEEIQGRNILRLTSVTHEFERLKKTVLIQPSGAKTATQLEAKPSTTSTVETTQKSTQPEPRDPKGNPAGSSSLRTMPPKYTAQEEVNLERLASSLMANLVRLEGHSVRSRDLPHITGERGPWKAVIDRLLTLGKIDHQGNLL